MLQIGGLQGDIIIDIVKGEIVGIIMYFDIEKMCQGQFLLKKIIIKI